MSKIKFSKEDKDVIVSKITRYFDAELSQDIGQFDCEFLLDFISEEVGVYFYNQGLTDAQAILAGKMDEIIYAIDEIEMPIKPL